MKNPNLKHRHKLIMPSMNDVWESSTTSSVNPFYFFQCNHVESLNNPIFDMDSSQLVYTIFFLIDFWTETISRHHCSQHAKRGNSDCTIHKSHFYQSYRSSHFNVSNNSKFSCKNIISKKYKLNRNGNEFITVGMLFRSDCVMVYNNRAL